MTCGELIELLKAYPRDLRVVVQGYEAGYADVQEGSEIRLKRDVNTEWWYGPHEETDESGEKHLCIR